MPPPVECILHNTLRQNHTEKNLHATNLAPPRSSVDVHLDAPGGTLSGQFLISDA